MRAFHEAVYAFGVEWSRDAGAFGLEFMESEKALFEEVAASLPPSVLERYNAVTEIRRDWDDRANGEDIFEMTKNSLFKAKLFFEKVKTRPFGIRFRPACDTMILRDEDIDHACKVLSAFKKGESNAQNVRSFAIDERIIQERPRIWDALFGRERPWRTMAGSDTPDEDVEMLDDNDESNADFAKPLLTGLDELTVIVNRGFYNHPVNGNLIDYTYEEVNDLKQKLHDVIFLRMKHRSALAKIPKIIIEREDHMYGWTRWEEPLGPSGSTFAREKVALWYSANEM